MIHQQIWSNSLLSREAAVTHVRIKALRRAVCDMTHIRARARACCVSPHPFGNDKSGYYVLEIGTSITPDRRIELDIIFGALNFRSRPRMSEEKRERNRRAIPVGNLSRSTIFIYKRAAPASN